MRRYFVSYYENQTSFPVVGKGLAGARLKLASAKMAKVPTVVKMTKIQRNMRSTTMATYCQSFFSWKGTEGADETVGRRGKLKLKRKAFIELLQKRINLSTYGFIVLLGLQSLGDVCDSFHSRL